MVTVRLVNAQAVADVMLALRRDALQSRCVARKYAQLGDVPTEKIGRIIATAERLEELAERINEQLTIGEKVEVARCGS